MRGWYTAAVAYQGTAQSAIEFLAMCGHQVCLPAPETWPQEAPFAPLPPVTVQWMLHRALTERGGKIIGGVFVDNFSEAFAALVRVSSRVCLASILKLILRCISYWSLFVSTSGDHGRNLTADCSSKR